MSARGAGQLLDVFLAGEPVGRIERRSPVRYRFQYSPHTVEHYGAGALVLSVSLPVRGEPFTPSETSPFFEGLLPEGAVRDTIAKNLKLSVGNGFGLLQALGAECAGAVTLTSHADTGDRTTLTKDASEKDAAENDDPEKDDPKKDTPAKSPAKSVPAEDDPAEDGGVRWLGDEELGQLVRELPEHPLGVSDGRQVRLSLGGVQEKLLLIRTPSGRFGQPLQGGPSTHILKPGQERFPGLVANEAFCLRVVRCAGLPVAKAEIMEVAGQRCLLVERFDRTYDEQARITRLHQEDVCQALGRLPSAKYEVEGGPSLADVFALLRELASVGAARDLNNLMLATVLNWLLGNSDAHGKNFGLLYHGAGAIRLAPLYDIVSTNIYDLKPEMAMLIGGVEEPARVDAESWRRMGTECGLGGQLSHRVATLVEGALRCARATRDVTIAEGWHEPAIDEIVALAERRAAQLL